MDNAADYQVQFYKDGELVKSVAVQGATSYDFEEAIKEFGTGKYTFDVQALGDGQSYLDSDLSARSPEYDYIKSLRAPTNLTWDADEFGVVHWDKAEGAVGYRIRPLRDRTPFGDPIEVGANSTSFNLRPYLPGEGEYRFQMQSLGDGIIYKDSVWSIISALVSYPMHWITASAGEGGSINPNGEIKIEDGKSQEFTVTADSSYELTDLLVDGVSQGKLERYTFENVTGDHTIFAIFAPLPEDENGTSAIDVQTPAVPASSATGDQSFWLWGLLCLLGMGGLLSSSVLRKGKNG